MLFTFPVKDEALSTQSSWPISKSIVPNLGWSSRMDKRTPAASNRSNDFFEKLLIHTDWYT